ncbi:cytochrome b [Oscillatoria sp. FACHB-1407]|uniref:cytochrome b n=1 Tax=Oscillatoria sp. FACHB-1407 TaxID=2692847 RepID=UPI001682FC35|nr:cytochrome b [Oscillatoria sp. FACHB-1407]MBD2462517.1 cytochrome b [Oscillatoria sp. FACHB-1407]
MSSQLIPPKPTVQTPKQATKPQARLNSAFKQLWSVHWWMAAFYLVLFVGGFAMEQMSEEIALREHAYTLHKSIGALTMALLTLRIFILQRVWWRKYTRRLPKINGEWIRAFLLHTAIYVFMLAVPLSGFFLSNSYQSGNVPFFWLTLPDIFPQNSAVVGLARNLHFWLAYTFLAFIVMHMIDQQKYVRSLWRRANQALKKMSVKQS